MAFWIRVYWREFAVGPLRFLNFLTADVQHTALGAPACFTSHLVRGFAIYVLRTPSALIDADTNPQKAGKNRIVPSFQLSTFSGMSLSEFFNHEWTLMYANGFDPTQPLNGWLHR